MAGRAPARPTTIEGVGTNATFAYGPGDLISCPSKLTGTALIRVVQATKRLDRGDAPISWIGLRALKRGQLLQVESILSTDPFEVIKAAEDTGKCRPARFHHTRVEHRARREDDCCRAETILQHVWTGRHGTQACAEGKDVGLYSCQQEQV